jgi:hypothetical protein
MPELVNYKVRVVVEYQVMSAEGFAAAAAYAESRIAPVVRTNGGDSIDKPYARDAKIVSVEAERD